MDVLLYEEDSSDGEYYPVTQNYPMTGAGIFVGVGAGAFVGVGVGAFVGVGVGAFVGVGVGSAFIMIIFINTYYENSQYIINV